MMSKLFDKKFVNFMWEDWLDGKECFYSDTIAELRIDVGRGIPKNAVKGSADSRYPFCVDDSRNYRFCYYDPLYDFKRAYYVDGKIIQYHDKSNWKWYDIQGEPKWECGPEEYRIKPDNKFATHRELAEWLAKGHGQYMFTNSVMYHGSFIYEDSHDNVPLPDDIRVRKWGDNEWYEPTQEYMFGGECNE